MDGRALNVTERTFLDWNRSSEGDWNPFVTLHITPALNESVVRSGLHLLVQRFAFLQVRVTNDSHFEKQDGAVIPLRVVEREGDEHWQRVLEEEYVRGPIDDTCAPFARAVLVWSASDVSRCELIMCMHHMFVDGVSIAPLVDELLGLCESVSRGEEVEVVEAHSIDFFDRMRQVLERVEPTLTPQPPLSVPQPWAPLPLCSASLEAVPPSSRRPGTVFRVVDADALRERCHAHGTTVTAALAAASLLVGGARVRNEGTYVAGTVAADGSVHAAAVIVVNMRDHLDGPVEAGPEAVGDCNAVLQFPCSLPSDTADVWELACRVRSDLASALVGGAHWHATRERWDQASRACEGDTLTETNEGVANAASNLVSVSNVGLAGVKVEYDGFAVVDCFLSTAGRVFPPTLVLISGTWVPGRLAIAFSYMEPLMSKARTEEMADDVVGLLVR